MKEANVLRELGAICARQAGLVTAAQARAGGLSSTRRRSLVRSGALEPVGRGVYLWTSDPEPNHLDIRVAWLRLDPAAVPWERDGLGLNDGVVSHRSACVLHELGDIPAPAVELTVARRRRVTTPHVVTRVRASLSANEVERLDGLPVTTVARTIVDLLRDSADGGHVGGVIADAQRRELIDPERLAPRVSRFASRYAMPGADGLELLAMLAAMSVPT